MAKINYKNKQAGNQSSRRDDESSSNQISGVSPAHESGVNTELMAELLEKEFGEFSVMLKTQIHEIHNEIQKEVHNTIDRKLFDFGHVLSKTNDLVSDKSRENVSKIDELARIVSAVHTSIKDTQNHLESLGEMQKLKENNFLLLHQVEKLETQKRVIETDLEKLKKDHSELDEWAAAESKRKEELERYLEEAESRIASINQQMLQSEQRYGMCGQEIVELRRVVEEYKLKLVQLDDNARSLQNQISFSAGLEKHIWPDFMNGEPFIELKKRLMHELSDENASTQTLVLLSTLFRYRSTPCEPGMSASVTAFALVAYDLGRHFMEYGRWMNMDNQKLIEFAKILAVQIENDGFGSIKIFVPIVGQAFDNLRMVQIGKPSNASILKVNRVFSWAVLKQNITLHKAEVEV